MKSGKVANAEKKMSCFHFAVVMILVFPVPGETESLKRDFESRGARFCQFPLSRKPERRGTAHFLQRFQRHDAGNLLRPDVSVNATLSRTKVGGNGASRRPQFEECDRVAKA